MQVIKSTFLVLIMLFSGCSRPPIIEDDDFTKALTCGILYVRYYKDCGSIFEPKFKVEGRHVIYSWNYKGDVYSGVYVQVDGIRETVFMLVRADEKYYFSHCVSSKEIFQKDGLKKNEIIVPVGYSGLLLEKSPEKEALIENIKTVLMRMGDIKKHEANHFFIKPFCDKCSGMDIYWEEERRVISIARALYDDADMKAVNAAQVAVYDNMMIDQKTKEDAVAFVLRGRTTR